MHFINKFIHNILTVCAQNFLTDRAVQTKIFGHHCPTGALCDHGATPKLQARHPASCSFLYRFVFSNTKSNWIGLLINHSGLFPPIPKRIVPKSSGYISYWNFQHLHLECITNRLALFVWFYGCSVVYLLCFFTYLFISFLFSLSVLALSVPTQLFYTLILPLVLYFSPSVTLL